MIVFVLAQRANPDEGPLSVAAHLFLPFMLYVDVSVYLFGDYKNLS